MYMMTQESIHNPYTANLTQILIIHCHSLFLILYLNHTGIVHSHRDVTTQWFISSHTVSHGNSQDRWLNIIHWRGNGTEGGQKNCPLTPTQSHQLLSSILVSYSLYFFYSLRCFFLSWCLKFLCRTCCLHICLHGNAWRVLPVEFTCFRDK